MLDDLVLTHLKGALNSDFKAFKGTLEFNAIKPTTIKSPALYVMPIADKAQSNKTISLVNQQITRSFAVFIVQHAPNDRTGFKKFASIEALRKKVRDQLLGWSPSPEYDPIEFSGGAVLPIDGQFVFWRDLYSTTTQYRSQL